MNQLAALTTQGRSLVAGFCEPRLLLVRQRSLDEVVVTQQQVWPAVAVEVGHADGLRASGLAPRAVAWVIPGAARDEDLRPTGVAGRLHRAQWNFLETFPLLAACVVIVHLADRAGSLSHWGGLLYLAGRILFLPLYAMGVPWLRTLSWNLAILGLVLVGAQVFF